MFLLRRRSSHFPFQDPIDDDGNDGNDGNDTKKKIEQARGVCCQPFVS
jgi:hypothetical protein